MLLILPRALLKLPLAFKYLDMFSYFVSFLVAGLTVLFVMAGLRLYWHSKLSDWAVGEGFRLVSFRSARLKEGPERWRQRHTERLFRVAVEDDMRSRRAGWLIYGPGKARASEPAAKVLWDELND